MVLNLMLNYIMFNYLVCYRVLNFMVFVYVLAGPQTKMIRSFIFWDSPPTVGHIQGKPVGCPCKNMCYFRFLVLVGWVVSFFF